MIKGYFGADSTDDSSQPKSVTKKAFLEFLTAQLHFSGNDTPEMLFQKLRDQGTIHTTGLGGRVHVLGGRKPSSDEEAVAKPETAENRDDFTLEDITQGQHILEAIVRLGTNPSSGKRHQESGATEGQIVNSTPEVSAGTKEMLQKLRRTGIIETYTPSNGSGIKYRITAEYFKEFYTTGLRSILQTLQ